MPNPYQQDQIENWASDFVTSDALRTFPPPLREIAGDLLVAFLSAATTPRNISPADIEEQDLKPALLSLAKLNIPSDALPHVPALIADFLASLESEGRLAGGRSLAAFTRALTPAFLDAASPKTRPITNPGSKIGRNDPCPCGSGKKYKKCCMTSNTGPS
jgi:uncharacterized protein YchJ